MNYTSINNPKIKSLAKLKQKKYRDEENLFLVEGKHLVSEAYQAGLLQELFVLEGLEYNLDVETSTINKSVLNYLTDLETSPGIIGLCHKKPEKILGTRLLLLDGIQDPGNLGTIIRSAVAFDIDSIIINDKCVDPYSAKVIRSTQGLIFKINLSIKNLDEFVKTIKGKIPILATKVTGGKSLKSLEKISEFAIIMGNEGNGVSQSLLDICDEYLYIPMNKECESLNVGVAASIILYELKR
jgi:TrmH family RNA methyltransferase